MIDWKEIKEEYVAGDVSYRKLAAMYGVPCGTLGKIAGREGWAELKKNREPAQRIETSEKNCAGEKSLNNIQEVTLIADKLLARLSELVDHMQLDTQGIKQIVSALKELREIKEYPSEIDLRRARLRKIERETDAYEDGPREIEIVFKAGPEAWNE